MDKISRKKDCKIIVDQLQQNMCEDQEQTQGKENSLRHSFIILGILFSLICFCTGCGEKELETNRVTTETLEQGFDTKENEDETFLVTFYICGQVENPGVYSLPDGSRVEDAIHAAGGVLEEADMSQVNLARRVKEEEQIVIYAMDKDIPYFAVNVPNDTCLECGYCDEFNDTCPVCGSHEIQQLRRVTGYLTGDFKTAFNLGKQDEVAHRVKHVNKIPKVGD